MNPFIFYEHEERVEVTVEASSRLADTFVPTFREHVGSQRSQIGDPTYVQTPNSSIGN
jgi:hypothetical protein